MRVFVTLAIALGGVVGGCDFAPEPVAVPGDDPERGASRAGGAVSAPDEAFADPAPAPPSPDAAAPSDPPPPPPPPSACCGDGVCAEGEDCVTCRSDCGHCSVCGDGVCAAGESASSCATDCAAALPAHCGNGACGGNESCSLCADDCGPCPSCGDGVCGAGEDCAMDCGGTACP